MSQNPIHDNSNYFNNINSFNVQNNYVVADDRPPLLTWLSPLEPRLRHQDIQERRADNVGGWLLQTEEFRIWQDWSNEGEGNKAVLFCYGGPGVGKTFISSLVVDRLCDQSRGQNSAVTCFYLDFAARKEQSATSILGSLLRQVVGGMEKIPEEISQAFEEQKNEIGGRRFRLPDIVKMLQAITSSLPTFICLDALDECAVTHRVKLLNSLQQILAVSPRTRIFIIGRPHVRAEVEKRLAGRVTSMSVVPGKDDIMEYLRLRLDEDETPDAMTESLEAEIMEKIPETMSEMFLLVSLTIDAVLHESTISRRREKLRELTKGVGLGDVYGATMERIKAQDGDKSRFGMAALMWISHAEQPLRADELCHALAVQIGSRDFDIDNIPSVSTLVSCCHGLITVDKEESTVRLIHFTLQEYFSARPEIFSQPHSEMAEICLTYLNCQQVKALSTAPSPDAQSAPFLEYCSAYWGVHAKRELSDCGRSLALELLKENYGPISTASLLAQVKGFPHWRFYTFYPFNGLHCASIFGIVEVVVGLIEMECYDINEGDFSGRAPLAWASRNGHEGVVEALLCRGEINPDKPDNSGRTALSLAAEYGHEGVVEILLRREEVNPDKSDTSFQTPLSFAARSGHGAVVKILLGREEVKPDKPDYYGQTPLSYAAEYGHEGVVKMLLGAEEVNPYKPDIFDDTPLSFAAANGHEGVVKMLLGREEVNPDKPNNAGRTPLSLAARSGHEGVVKILLRRPEVNPDRPGDDGQTPLSLAATYGHEAVVKILLGREEVNPGKPGVFGETPLLYAARNGQEGVVEILLGRQDVDPDKPDNTGRTPLWWAARDGYEGVVKILLGREDVNPDKLDGNGRTPLSWAAEYGHERIVAILRSPKAISPGTF